MNTKPVPKKGRIEDRRSAGGGDAPHRGPQPRKGPSVNWKPERIVPRRGPSSRGR